MTDGATAPQSPPTTRDVAVLLSEIGILLELTGGDPFRARAYASAARALEGVSADLYALAQQDRLTTLRAVGPGIAAVIREYVLTGRSTLYEDLRAKTPIGIYDLLRVPGLGSKRIHTLHKELGIESLDALEAAARDGRLATLPGFGRRIEEKVLEGIAFARSARQLRRYPQALETAVRLLEWLRDQTGVRQAEIAGQLRRRLEVVDRIDLVAACEDPAGVLEAFRSFLGAAEVDDEREDEAMLRLTDGMTARLRCVRPGDFAAAMLWETGNDAHLNGLVSIAERHAGRLDANGLTLAGRRLHLRRESSIYDRLGLQYVPPELREGLDELELAAARALPDLVTTEDLHGTFHCHTTYSDGRATIAELVAAARDRGWSYLGLGDHSRSAGYARGLSIESVRRQHAEVDALNRDLASGDRPFRIFKGIESDILTDGRLDYPDDVLADFDYVVGSVHSGFTSGREAMTERVIRAVRHPALTILGHPTGRLLLTRAGYEIDIDAVIAAAAEVAMVIEINADPHRLDLDWRHVRTAARMGVLFAINPDAHSVRALDNVAFGVNMARKAGLSARQVVNAWPLEEVEAFFTTRKRREGAGKHGG